MSSSSFSPSFIFFLFSFLPGCGCAGTHSCCEFVITMTLWSPEDSASEQSFISLGLNFFLPLSSMQFPVCLWACTGMLYACVYMWSPLCMHVYMCIGRKGVWHGCRKPSLLSGIMSFYLSLCEYFLLGVLIMTSLANHLPLGTFWTLPSEASVTCRPPSSWHM